MEIGDRDRRPQRLAHTKGAMLERTSHDLKYRNQHCVQPRNGLVRVKTPIAEAYSEIGIVHLLWITIGGLWLDMAHNRWQRIRMDVIDTTGLQIGNYDPF